MARTHLQVYFDHQQHDLVLQTSDFQERNFVLQDEYEMLVPPWNKMFHYYKHKYILILKDDVYIYLFIIPVRWCMTTQNVDFIVNADIFWL